MSSVLDRRAYHVVRASLKNVRFAQPTSSIHSSFTHRHKAPVKCKPTSTDEKRNLKHLRNGKTVGEEGTTPASFPQKILFKLLAETHELFPTIWRTESCPKDWFFCIVRLNSQQNDRPVCAKFAGSARLKIS